MNLRRRLLLPFLPLLSALSAVASAQYSDTVDVAIVGAGLSGLSAAKDLIAAGKKVVVVEARDRVGGRVENFNLTNGGVVELGAAYVGPTQDRVLALAAELGLQPFPEYNDGNNVLVSQGQRATYANDSVVPPLDDASLVELATLVTELDTMAASIDVNAPWTHPNASVWDAMTLQSFLANVTTTEPAAAFVETATAAVFSAQSAELSFLYVLAYIAAAGNESTPGTFERLLAVPGGAQESRIVGGTGLLPTRLADRLGSHTVVLNAPVRSITGGPAGYTVSADNNYSVIAQDVIIAMSPPLAARIAYDPPLPAQRDQLTQRMFMGALGKAIAIYATPFWRALNLTGQAVSDSGTTRATFDVSPADGAYGALLAFLEADEMRMLDDRPEAEIQARVQRDFVAYFGEQATAVTQWVVQRWDNEVYSRGAPVALAGPGTLTKYGPALTKPFGKIHFAGTESSPYWTGYMDGAIRSGERAAKEILG